MALSTVDLEQLILDLEQKNFPRHIAELPVKDKFKQAFTLYERMSCVLYAGFFPDIGKENRDVLKGLPFKKRYALVSTLQTHTWWAFFFGPVYYFFTGMWRKGLALLGVLLLLGIAIEVLLYLLAESIAVPDAMTNPLAIVIAMFVSMMATYDQYRVKVKKEAPFWW